MSISYSTYVGPYARCTVGQIEVTKERRACTNTACENHKRDICRPDAFCHRCGAAIGPVAYTETDDAVDRWEVRDAVNDRLMNPSGDGFSFWGREHNTHLWIPNIATPWRDCHLETHTDFALVEITAKQIQDEMRAFSTFFVAELDVLIEWYGRAAVSVHWGIIQDYS